MGFRKCNDDLAFAHDSLIAGLLIELRAGSCDWENAPNRDQIVAAAKSAALEALVSDDAPPELIAHFAGWIDQAFAEITDREQEDRRSDA